MNFYKPLVSLIIGHGILDLIDLTKSKTKFSIYILQIYFYHFFLTILPDFATLIFILASSYHFGQDFKFFNFSKNKTIFFWKLCSFNY